MDASDRRRAVRLVFSGRNIGAGFLDFVEDRARRFGLDGWAAIERPDAATVLVAGPEALVDMLEVACLLGPADCLVETVEHRELRPGSLGPGFALRPAA